MMTQKWSRGAEIRNARRLVQVAGLTFYLLAVQALLTAGVGLDVYLSGHATSDLLLSTTSALLAACYALVGYFLRRYRVWARNFAFAFAAVSMFAFPVGTVLGVLLVLCIDRANRGRVFLERRRAPRHAAPISPIEENAPILRFEPELAAERVV
ncbi:MAG: hypothetical protein ABI968_03070 [Acidobacteriota bacterium]